MPFDPKTETIMLEKLEEMEKHPYVPPKTEVKVSQTEDDHMKADITIEPGDIPNGPYTVRQLIEALQKCKNQDAPVNVYLLGEAARIPITYVDDTFENNRMVDLNIHDEVLYEQKSRPIVQSFSTVSTAAVKN